MLSSNDMPFVGILARDAEHRCVGAVASSKQTCPLILWSRMPPGLLWSVRRTALMRRPLALPLYTLAVVPCQQLRLLPLPSVAQRVNNARVEARVRRQQQASMQCILLPLAFTWGRQPSFGGEWRGARNAGERTGGRGKHAQARFSVLHAGRQQFQPTITS